LTIDLEELAAVVRLIKDAEFTEFRYSKGDTALVVCRGALVADADERPSGAAPRSEPAPVNPEVVEAPRPAWREVPSAVAIPEGPMEIVKAPLLGTFYSAPKPGEPPFVKVGVRVEADTVVCIIEVMKLMNSVVAGVAGVVAAIHVADGELVEHGQTLFSIVPAAA
jgi:acetyl-CoA carboxylase biotin carboxyl carrier protein